MDEKAIEYAQKYGDTVNKLSSANTKRAAMKESIEELIKKWQERADELEYRIASYCHHGVSKEATPLKGRFADTEAFISDLTNLLKQNQ